MLNIPAKDAIDWIMMIPEPPPDEAPEDPVPFDDAPLTPDDCEAIILLLPPVGGGVDTAPPELTFMVTLLLLSVHVQVNGKYEVELEETVSIQPS